jgi:hypothetical protein
MWFDLILPVNMQKKTSLIAASSPKGATRSYFGKMIKRQRKDGSFIFNSVRAPEICEECFKKREFEICPHGQHNRSTNKSTTKMTDAKILYEDEPTRAKEELGGAEVALGGDFFSEEQVDSIRQNCVKLTKKPRCVYLSMDPGGGSITSELGIIIACEDGADRIVVRTFIHLLCRLLGQFEFSFQNLFPFLWPHPVSAEVSFSLHPTRNNEPA